MNTALKHWREAATVILAAGLRRTPTADSLKAGLGKVTDIAHKSAFDYQVLLLKRSGRSGYMPNAYVFPGGLVESSDFSSEWQEIFKAFTEAPNYGIGVVKQPPASRPPIFATDRSQLGSPIPGDVAFRICAVKRRLRSQVCSWRVPKHEESGIRVHTDDNSDSQPTLTRLTGLWSKDVLSKSAAQLQIKGNLDSSTSVGYYDLGRMCYFPALGDLHRFAWQRSLEGCEQWLPIYLVSPDCHASLSPAVW
ncbi:nucleoside diphosphate-linked moiety X motif [Pimephales promelas]|nr:nucleoside diphosphate-linked moiety X motif [Pimephales promelas]